MLSPCGTPVSHCTAVPAASIVQAELRLRTRVTWLRSKRTKTNRLSGGTTSGNLSELEFRLPVMSSEQSEQQSEYENWPGFNIAEGMAYPAQTFVSVERATSAMVDASDPFSARWARVPLTIRGMPSAPS